MRPQGHLAGGAILGYLLRRRLGVAAPVAMAAGALAANGPDADVAAGMVANRFLGTQLRTPEHHAWFTHAPVTSLAISWLVGRHSPQLGLIGAAGSMLHLAQDAFVDEVVLLWPVSRRSYGVRYQMVGTMSHGAWLKAYKRTANYRIEQGLMVAAGVLLLRSAVAVNTRRRRES